LLMRSLAKVKESEAAIATTLVELPESLKMMRPSTYNLPKLMNKLRPRRSITLLGSVADYAASAWLQYRYGILPALSEVDTYRKVFSKKAEVKLTLDRRSSHETEETVDYTTDFSGRLSTLIPSFYGHGSEVSTVDEYWVSTAYAQRSVHLASRLGLDAAAIPMAIWERIPYSFVVDWFLDIGTWIRASVPQPSCAVVGQTLSRVRKCTYTCKLRTATYSTPWIGSPDYPEASCYGGFYHSTKAYRRTRAGYQIGIPSFTQGVNSIIRELDSLALSYSRIAGNLNRRR
jgi:hypothetical protein